MKTNLNKSINILISIFFANANVKSYLIKLEDFIERHRSWLSMVSDFTA